VRFAIYHPWVYLRSGLERTFLELCRRSRHEWVTYTHHHQPDTTYDELSNYTEVIELTPRVSVQRSLIPLVGAAATIARARLPQDGSQGLLVSSEGLGDFILNHYRGSSVAFCHTPLKILYDPATREALRAQSRSKYAVLQMLGPAFGLADRRMWRRFDHVFANSSETKKRIGAARLRDPSDVEVLYPGVDIERFVVGPDQRPPQLLVAGRIMWQKNIELAIETVRLLAGEGLSIPLVVAGAVDDKSRPYLAQLRAAATGLPVEFRPDPTDDELMDLYRTSTLLLFTARNEDFGMVPLEAMASGTPVLAVDRGGPRETVVSGVTGWLEPPEPRQFADRVRAALSDDQLTRMRRPARARAEEFGWDRFVARIDDVMEEVAARHD
jgi:glycosyltransferase involved in cell wall biosynthesis